MSYTVDFYNSYDATSNTYQNLIADASLSIQDGESITSAGLSLPESSIFTAPAGEYFDKLYYIPEGTATPKEFTEATKITSDTKVYATYVNGHTVTFNSNYPSGTQTTKDVTVSPKAGATIAETQKPTVGKSSDDLPVTRLRAGLHKQTVAMKSYLMMVQILHLQLTFLQSPMFMLIGYRM